MNTKSMALGTNRRKRFPRRTTLLALRAGNAMRPHSVIAVIALATAPGAISGCNDQPAHGSWCDEVSGLCWQDPPPEETFDWAGAVAYCEELELDGHGDWRLPSISELRSSLRGWPDMETAGICGVTDECLEIWCANASCLTGDYPKVGEYEFCYRDPVLRGPCTKYWSASTVADLEDAAWIVDFLNPNVYALDKAKDTCLRCVRGKP